MMYVYHITTKKNFGEIVGDKFCARLYTPRYSNLMHKKLHLLHNELEQGSSIFRFCFYDDLIDAQVSYNRDFAMWDSYIFRFRKNQFAEMGFKWQWDEGFKEGVAHLFWIKEMTNTTEFSIAGIPFHDIDVLLRGNWIALSLCLNDLT